MTCSNGMRRLPRSHSPTKKFPDLRLLCYLCLHQILSCVRICDLLFGSKIASRTIPEGGAFLFRGKKKKQWPSRRDQCGLWTRHRGLLRHRGPSPLTRFPPESVCVCACACECQSHHFRRDRESSSQRARIANETGYIGPSVPEE